MLLLNNKLSATVAQQRGLVTEILDKDFTEHLKTTVQRLRSMPTQVTRVTLRFSKRNGRYFLVFFRVFFHRPS